jgi:hypothetical protein
MLFKKRPLPKQQAEVFSLRSKGNSDIHENKISSVGGCFCPRMCLKQTLSLQGKHIELTTIEKFLILSQHVVLNAFGFNKAGGF